LISLITSSAISIAGHSAKKNKAYEMDPGVADEGNSPAAVYIAVSLSL